MAQKPPILLYHEAQGALIQTVQYFIQQGVPAYELKQIIDIIGTDLANVIEQEIKKAREQYQEVLEQEKKQEENKAE